MAKPIQINLNKFFEGVVPKERISSLKIGVALSGGRDSIALAHALNVAGVQIVAINIEHGIRGESSINDSKFVADWCKAHGILLKAYAAQVPEFCNREGYTLEQGARILRYQVFDGILERGECDYIALAHHAGDQTETLFLRILRGTGIKGLIGMSPINGKYIRPLLGYTREDIDAYVVQNALQFVDDESNLDTTYTRNFIRAQLAQVRTRFPSLDDAVARLVHSAHESESFVESFVPVPLMEDGEAYINISDLRVPLIAKKLIMRAANEVGVYQDIEERHFPLIVGLKDAENGKRLELPHGLRVHKQESFLVFSAAKSDADNSQIPFGEGEFTRLGIKIEYISEKPASFGNALYIDIDKLPDGAVLRSRRDGDFINKFGGGKKSLGDFLTDKKVPLRMRDTLTVLAVDNEIFAVFGIDISAKVAIGEYSQNICRLSCTKV